MKNGDRYIASSKKRGGPSYVLRKEEVLVYKDMSLEFSIDSNDFLVSYHFCLLTTRQSFIQKQKQK